MGEIIQTIGIAVSSILALAVLVVIVRSQWDIYRREQRQEQQAKAEDSNNNNKNV